MKKRSKCPSTSPNHLIELTSNVRHGDHSDKPLKRRSQSVHVTKTQKSISDCTNTSNVKRPSSFLKRSNLLAQSNKYFKEHSAIALKTSKSLGQTDTYFKKSLRNYVNLDLVTTRSPNRIKSRRSRICNVYKERIKKAEGDSKFFSASESSLTSLSQKQTSPRGLSEEDSDNFYSPDRVDYASGDFKYLQLEKLHIDEKQVKQHPLKLFPRSSLKNATLETVVEETQTKCTLLSENEGETLEEQPAMSEEEIKSRMENEEDADAEKDEEENAESPQQNKSKKHDDEVPTDEKSVLKEVEECEAQCMEIYKILSELKSRVSELLSKSERTADENRELEEKQKALNDKMAMLEQKTRRIELLVARTRKPKFNKVYDEDALPKVVVCGLEENNMPKFIICDDKKRRQGRKAACSPLMGSSKLCPNANLPPQPFATSCMGGQGPGMMVGTPMQGMPTMAGFSSSYPPCCMPGLKPQAGQGVTMSALPEYTRKLSDSYDMQERLAKENAELEGKRYKLQEDLLRREQTLESVQRQLHGLQQEMRQVIKQNGALNNKLQEIQGKPGPNSTCSGSLPSLKACGPGKGPCPADDETRKLEKQLTLMELEVKAIQNELTTVRQERLHLEQHRRMLSPMTCPSPCIPPCMPPCHPRTDAQLREMREKYNCLQDDYKSKLTEVSGLRADVDKLKNALQQTTEGRKSLEAKIRELEKLLGGSSRDSKLGSFTKENFMEMEQQLQVAKQRFREAQDELDELRALTEEQQNQLGDYRNKYLEAQQQVEEQRRQMDLMELENNRIGEQVNLEIQRVKNQFQEKLQELTPLPDILKATQLKMQEAQQMHLMAERNNEALLREVQSLREKAVMAVEQMQANQAGLGSMDADRQTLQMANEDFAKQVELMQAENDDLRAEVDRMHGEVDDAEKRAQEKLHEIAQLSAEVENVRDESARQVARVKDRCETIRRSMQNEVCDLEKQLAQSRALAKSAQRDRDDIRQKMQSQINNLNENFDDAQMRIRALQGHVNFLKNSAAVYPSLDQMATNRNC